MRASKPDPCRRIGGGPTNWWWPPAATKCLAMQQYNIHTTIPYHTIQYNSIPSEPIPYHCITVQYIHTYTHGSSHKLLKPREDGFVLRPKHYRCRDIDTDHSPGRRTATTHSLLVIKRLLQPHFCRVLRHLAGSRRLSHWPPRGHWGNNSVELQGQIVIGAEHLAYLPVA